jgi:hypothetical protein
MTTEDIHTCHADCQRPTCVAVREAVAAEREACARVVEQAGIDGYGTLAAALLIRERGAP